MDFQKFELVEFLDLVALRLRCAEDAIHRAFDELSNDNKKAIKLEYVEAQLRHAQDYLGNAGRQLNLAIAEGQNAIVDDLVNKVKAQQVPPAELRGALAAGEPELTTSQMCDAVNARLDALLHMAPPA